MASTIKLGVNTTCKESIAGGAVQIHTLNDDPNVEIIAVGCEYEPPNYVSEDGGKAKGMAVNIMTALKGFKPYIHHETGHGSIYIKFPWPYEKVGSIRLSTHNGKAKYNYKWNLRSDVTKKFVRGTAGVVQYFFPWEDWKDMVRLIQLKGDVLAEEELAENDDNDINE